MKKRFLIILALALGLASVSNAEVIEVSDASQLEGYLKLNAGDTVILSDGVWEDLTIRFKSKNGTADRPVVFKGQTAGKTILTGSSSLAFAGDYVVVEDLWFKNPDFATKKASAVIQFRTSSSEMATNSVMRNCMITGFDLPLSQNEHKWVSIYGTDNIVEYCTFEDKPTMGTTLVVWPEPEVLTKEPNHIIRNNYFTRPRSNKSERGGSLNGQEVIRIGTSHVSMSSAGCTVENNVFEHCNGETEIISNKTCNNTFRGNVFIESVGCLTLRHGNGALVENNYFDGANVRGTGGIRLIGEDHIVRNNYMQDLEGSGYTSAICVMMGVTNSVLNNYFQVKNSVVSGNVAIDCRQGMAVNTGTRENQVEPFFNSRVENNVFVSRDIAAQIFNSPAPKDVVWQNNVFSGGRFEGCTFESLGGVEPKDIERQNAPVFENGASWNSK